MKFLDLAIRGFFVSCHGDCDDDDDDNDDSDHATCGQREELREL